MKRFFKVLGFIFSIIGVLTTIIEVWACIVVKSENGSIRKFYKDAFMFGYNYYD